MFSKTSNVFNFKRSFDATHKQYVEKLSEVNWIKICMCTDSDVNEQWAIFMNKVMPICN